MAIFIVSVTAIQGNAEPEIVKLGTAVGIDHPTCQSLKYFQQEMERIKGRQITIQLFPDSLLGTADEVLDGLQFGNIEMGILSSDILTSLSPLFSAISMPYIFRDDAHRFRVLDGPVGVGLLELLERNNLVGLGFLDTGSKNFVTKQQHVLKPEDVQGLKIGGLSDCSEKGCPDVVSQLFWDSLSMQGAVIEPIPQEEVYEALQSAKIDGWAGNEMECLSQKIVETGARYFTYSEHSSVPDVLVAGKLWFDSLSPEIQTTIRKAARLTVRQQRKLWRSFAQEAVSQLETNGMKFEETNRELFHNKVQPLYTKMYKELGPEFEELVQAIMAVK